MISPGSDDWIRILYMGGGVKAFTNNRKVSYWWRYSPPTYDKGVSESESSINLESGSNSNQIGIYFPSTLNFVHIHLRAKIKKFDTSGFHDIILIDPYNILLYDGENRLSVYYNYPHWPRPIFGPTINLNTWYYIDYVINNKIRTVYINGSNIGSFTNNSGIDNDRRILITNGRDNSSHTLVDDIFVSTTPVISGNYTVDSSKFFMEDYTNPFKIFDENNEIYGKIQ